jgi:hypothetical protein
MSHPNPYLFQINWLDVKLVAGWIFHQMLVRTRCRMDMDSQGCIRYYITQKMLYHFVRAHIDV